MAPLLFQPRSNFTVTQQRHNNHGKDMRIALATSASRTVVDWVPETAMDFSYYDGTPYLNTQYFREDVALVGEDNLDSLYIRAHNPHLDTWFFTDPAYYWYRECFLEMAADGDCATYKCTGGGILFGDGISFIPLADFLARHAPARRSDVA